MGDYGTIDEFTQGLLDTLEKLDLYDEPSYLDIAMMRALNSFGQPNELLVSPQMYEDLKKALDKNGKK